MSFTDTALNPLPAPIRPIRPARAASGRKVLALMLALFALPFATAFGLYALHWRPATVASHGTLVNPLVALPLDRLRRLDGTPIGRDVLRDRWLLVLALPGRCEAACVASLDETRRIQVALYRDMGRVARLVLADAGNVGGSGDGGLDAAAKAAPDLLIAQPVGAWRALVRAQAADMAADGAPQLYIVDPAGNLVMRYDARPDPAGVKSDLQHLLKFSWQG